jgi:cell division protein FtsQ
MTIHPRFKKVLFGVLVVIASGAFLVMLGFVDHRQSALKCQGLVINIVNEDEHDFIDRNEVRDIIQFNGSVLGKTLGAINMGVLEKRILNNPYVKHAEVYSALDGTLHTDLVQRTPIVRIVNMSEEQFYIDNEGVFMPTSDRYTPPVLVASGFIFNRFSEGKVHYQFNSGDPSAHPLPRIIEQVYVLASHIEADSFWSANTEQIYVNEHQELEMIPRVGSHRILLGDTVSLGDKLERLHHFYREGLSKTGWNKYALINLKYKNQVVCTKTN